jgi:hypothetical protein
MSKSIIGEQLWAEMTEDQKIEAVVSGHATLKQMSEGLLDGSEQLRNACRQSLADTSPSFENLPAAENDAGRVDVNSNNQTPANEFSPPRTATKPRVAPPLVKQRFGLPDGFETRLQRYGRSMLIELNVYRLPNGEEFIPCRPSGTLGARRHMYALVTRDQYLKGRRGSVYVRNDGKIFDYSVDTLITSGELFDTGYTIADLERTGRYAPELPRRKKRRQAAQMRRAAAAS